MIKGWRLFFYTVIGAAVLSIVYITVKFILTERLVKATGDERLEIRQRAARKVMGRAANNPTQRKKAMDFLRSKPQPVRDNVVWSIEQMIAGGQGNKDIPTEWLVDIACDLSGEVPTEAADWDAARLAVQRLGAPAVPVLIERLGETTQRTLERDTYAHRRAVAARLLGVLADPSATKPLVMALRDEYEMVRQQAAAALARLNTPESQEPLRQYLAPLLGVLRGEYLCYVRLDSEGRLRRDPNREDLVYGPFVVTVKPHEQATPADLERQRDSSAQILEKEEARQAETRKRLEEGRRGQVIKVVKGPVDLAIEKVTIAREGLTVTDPVGKAFDVIEGEPVEIEVDVVNKGPGDLVSDFFVAVYGASPPPKNHVDRPLEGEEYAGERARDNRALAGVAEVRHVRSMYATDRPETPEKDPHDRVFVTMLFKTVEADRIEALRQLMYVAHDSTVPALGAALQDQSYTVRQQAAMALQRLLAAKQTSPAAKQQVVNLLRADGLASSDPVVRCLAAEALMLSADSPSAAALARLLRDADPTVRLVATRSLAALPEGDLKRILPTLDPGVRQVAPRLFSGLGDINIARGMLFGQDQAVAREVLRSGSRLLTVQDLVAALRIPDPRTRVMATRVLSERADPATQPALLLALQDKEGDVRAAAATGLGELMLKTGQKDPAIIAALSQVIKNEAGDYVGVPEKEEPEDPATAVITNKKSRAAAAEALAKLEDPATKDVLIEALKDSNPDVIAAVLPAVDKGLLGDQTERLVAIVEDVKLPARVRRAAILAIWHSGTKTEEGLDALVGLLNDTNDTVKTAASVALIGLGDNRGDKVLRDQLTSKNLDVRRDAATLLATLPDETVAKIGGIKKKDRDGLNVLIEDLYRSGSLAVNFRFLVRSFVFLGDQPRTLERMKAALKDPHPVLRAAGVTVLAQLGDPEAAGAARAMLADPNEVARAAAVEAAAELKLADVVPTLEQMALRPDPSEKALIAIQDALGRLDTGQ